MPAPVSEREARLAAALRENLKRRKAQARARAAEPANGRGAEPANARGAEPANGRKAPDGANPAPEAEADAPKDR